MVVPSNCCFQWFKDTNLKANHNTNVWILFRLKAVFNGSKILIWKQITTSSNEGKGVLCCFQWFKDTNLKANHNTVTTAMESFPAVFNGSKILIWKQITTQHINPHVGFSCFQWFKDTNLKANHNADSQTNSRFYAVFNGSKILIWKQITTWKAQWV